MRCQLRQPPHRAPCFVPAPCHLALESPHGAGLPDAKRRRRLLTGRTSDRRSCACVEGAGLVSPYSLRHWGWEADPRSPTGARGCPVRTANSSMMWCLMATTTTWWSTASTPDSDAERALAGYGHSRRSVRCYLTDMRTTISTKGQIVLPAELRAADGIEAGEEFEVDRVGPDEYRLTRLTPPPNRGLVEWLRSCPEDGWFVEIESESTDSL